MNPIIETTDILKLADAAALQGQDTSAKIQSGFEDIDGAIDGGFREGDFTVVSGVPGEGKTTLCRMFTLNFAKQNIPSLWFSYEMTYRELWDAFHKMGAETNLISYVPLELEDDYDWITRHIQKAVYTENIKAVFIDTLGDVVKSVKKQQELNNYATYLAQICKDLRNLAVKEKIMIFVVAHAVKNPRSKTNETTNADIANSNGIPAAATNIFHVWRDEESDNLSYVKIGKSRRDGTKKGWRYKFRFIDNKLIPEGRHLEMEGEEMWRSS